MAKIRVSNRQPDAGYTPFGSGFVLPGRYSVFIDDPQFDYVVEMDVEVIDGAPRCRTLKATSRSDGPSVTGEGIRKLPIAGFLRHTAQDAALRIVRQTADGSVAMVPVRSQDLNDLYKDLRRTARRKTAVDTDRLKAVADTYRTALANGVPPTRTVADEQGVAPSTASKLVRAARDAGLLPKTTRGKARS